MAGRSLNIPVRFFVDHPFMWLIRHEATGSILFQGRLKRPEGKEMNHDEF